MASERINNSSAVSMATSGYFVSLIYISNLGIKVLIRKIKTTKTTKTTTAVTAAVLPKVFAFKIF